jgi:uncharacterized protein YbjT (DUF2867 family)
MKLLVLGATGGIGRLIAQLALERGHEVTLYVRDADRLPDSLKVAGNEGKVRIISGILDDTPKLHEAIRSQDAVLSALGYPRDIETSSP